MLKSVQDTVSFCFFFLIKKNQMIILKNQQTRLRRLCERDCDYLDYRSTKVFKRQMFKVCICKALTVDMVEFSVERKERYRL